MLQSSRRPGGRASSGADGEYDPGEMRWVSGFVAMVGLWIAASPAIYDASSVLGWNNAIVGAGIATVAGASFLRPRSLGITTVAAASLAAVLGLWTVLAPAVVGTESASLLWSNVGAGSLVALVSGYHAQLLYDARARAGEAGG